MPGHTKCCTCHAKSSQQTWRFDAPKCNPSQEISELTSYHLWWTCLLYCACHGKCIFADPLQMAHGCHRYWKCYKTITFCSFLTRCTIPCASYAKRHLNVQKWSEHVVLFTFWLRNVLRATTACTFSTSQLPKVVRSWSWCVLYMLTSKMCFAPQRHALFRHLNFQKCSGAGVFCTFWLRNVLRATTPCTFSTSQLQKVLRTWCVLYTFDFDMCFAPQRRALFRHLNFKKCSEHLRTWGVFSFFTCKCASCHSGAQFFISHLASWLSAPAALASLLFDPPEPQIIGKTQRFATFLPFRAPGSSETVSFVIFFLLLLFSLTLPISAFHLSILSEVLLLNFFRWYFYGITMGFLREFYGILMGFLCGSYAISTFFLWSFYGISVGFLWLFHGISIIFLWDYFGMSVESKLNINSN